ncbi:MAG TPA: cation acetate symporter [Candidatus Acidoferrales bacterium]|nr:cation acetate symporter [Candidatus Acidoferrales bacterium]
MTGSTAAVLGLVAMAAVSLGAGLFARRWARTTSDFMVAARAVPPRVNAAAISGEYLSAASFLGIAGLVMQFGYDVLWYPVCYAGGYLLLLLFIAAPLRRFGAYTIPDFAEGRFDSPRFRRLAVILVLIIGFFYALPQMKAAGLTVQTASGLPYGVGIGIVALVVVAGVVGGGMRGITFVQSLQFAAKLFAISVPAFLLLIHFSGTGVPFAKGASGLERLTTTTRFQVTAGELWQISSNTEAQVARPTTIGWQRQTPTSSTSAPSAGFEGGTSPTVTVNHRHDHLRQLQGASRLPKGTITWKSTDAVTVAKGQPAPFGSETPASPTSSWIAPFGPLAGGTGHPLLFTYSLILAILLGTIGLPHILVRFYTNPDAKASRRTALLVLVLLGSFYIWPPILGALGRSYDPSLYGTNLTDAVVLILPSQLGAGWLGQLLSAVVYAGAFAAFSSTLSGLLVSLGGALGHDVYGRWLRPAAGPTARRRAFQLSALGAGVAAAALGLLVEGFDISVLVGWAFAIAASSFFPLLVLGIWWRQLTTLGASVGVALGGGVATCSIITTMVATVSSPLAAFLAQHSSLAVVLSQPAIVTVPLAFASMVGISLIRPAPPAGVAAKMVQLHAPELLGLRREYIPD